jgi:polysaccharide biosynthesis protein PslH
MSASGEVLFVTPVRPARQGNGLAMRAGLFLEGLARSHSVTVLIVPLHAGSPVSDDLVECCARDCLTLDLRPAHDPRREIATLLSSAAGRHRAEVLHPRPRLCRWATASVAAEVADLVREARLCHVLRLYLAPFLDAVLDVDERPRLTLDLDDRDAVVQRRLGDTLEAERYDRLEDYYVPRFDRVLTASTLDAAALGERHPETALSAVPNAVRPPPDRIAPARVHDLVFVGNLSYAPNVEAARWLCEQVRPLLPEVSIALVGSGPSPAVGALARLPGVTVAADVAAVAPWYAAAKVAVVPLWTAGGTRTKIVEALMHGRPVVSTTIGAEGLLPGSQAGVVVADTPPAFAAACRGLLEDTRRAASLADEGRRWVAEHASVQRIAGVIDEIACSILTP